MSISINNFNNICRTCSQSNNLVSIQENIYLIEILSNTIQIQIQLNDELPKNICINCIKELNQSYSFYNKCRATDAALKQCLIEQKLLNNENITNSAITEEISIKNETSDVDSLISDEFSKESHKPENNQHLAENEVSLPHLTLRPDDSCQTERETICSNCNGSFATNAELVRHLNDCQFISLDEPMEINESSDNEDPLDVSSKNLSERSRTKYQREHGLFLAHCKQNNFTECTEDAVMDYFLEKAKSSKNATLWCSYSMLKNTLIEENIDISKYPKLMAFLKQRNVDCKEKVSFTREQINRFLQKAPDGTYLMMKTALILGIAGGCHIHELMRMTMDHVEDKDSVLVVTIPNTRSNKTRTFVITTSESDWMAIYRKYYKCRATMNSEDRRLFLKYKDGKVINQPVGKNTFGRFPKLIAEYLKLSNPARYTGHCFLRTSALWFNQRRAHRKQVFIDEDDTQ